jgi:transposase
MIPSNFGSTFPLSHTPLADPHVPSSLPARRKRGAQPGNANSLRHGLFSSRHSTPFSLFNSAYASMRHHLSASPSAAPHLLSGLQDLSRQVADGLFPLSGSLKFLSVVPLFMHLLSFMNRLRMLQHSLARSQHDLEFVASNALGLILLDFRDSGLAFEADSFRFVLYNADQNSTLPEPSHLAFLTPEQWASIAPLLPAEKTRAHPGRPAAGPHILLDAILWKLSTAAPWSELPSSFPPAATCRRCYRRLLESGFLASLYIHLYKHLRQQAVCLPALVRQGCFTIQDRHRLALRPGLINTWQARTSLLFMQLAWQVLCRRRRKAGRADRLKA